MFINNSYPKKVLNFFLIWISIGNLLEILFEFDALCFIFYRIQYLCSQNSKLFRTFLLIMEDILNHANLVLIIQISSSKLQFLLKTKSRLQFLNTFYENSSSQILMNFLKKNKHFLKILKQKFCLIGNESSDNEYRSLNSVRTNKVHKLVLMN